MSLYPVKARTLSRQFLQDRGPSKYPWLLGEKDGEESGEQRRGGKGREGEVAGELDLALLSYPLGRAWEALGVGENWLELLGPSVRDIRALRMLLQVISSVTSGPCSQILETSGLARRGT